VKHLKQFNDIALINESFYSYGVSLVIWDHLLPDASERASPNPSQTCMILD